MFTASADVIVCAADSRVCDVRSPGTKLANVRSKAGKSDDGRSAVEGPCGFFGYLSQRMYVDEFEITSGESAVCSNDEFALSPE